MLEFQEKKSTKVWRNKPATNYTYKSISFVNYLKYKETASFNVSSNRDMTPELPTPQMNFTTVDGSEIQQSPVEVGSFSHYVYTGIFKTSFWWFYIAGFLNHQQYFKTFGGGSTSLGQVSCRCPPRVPHRSVGTDAVRLSHEWKNGFLCKDPTKNIIVLRRK